MAKAANFTPTEVLDDLYCAIAPIDDPHELINDLSTVIRAYLQDERVTVTYRLKISVSSQVIHNLVCQMIKHYGIV